MFIYVVCGSTGMFSDTLYIADVFYLRHIGFYICVVCIHIYIYINRYYICGLFIYVVCIYVWFVYICGLRQQ